MYVYDRNRKLHKYSIIRAELWFLRNRQIWNNEVTATFDVLTWRWSMQLLSPVIAATKQSRIPTIFVLYHPILLFYGLKHTCSQLSLIMQQGTPWGNYWKSVDLTEHNVLQQIATSKKIFFFSIIQADFFLQQIAQRIAHQLVTTTRQTVLYKLIFFSSSSSAMCEPASSRQSKCAH